MMRIEVGLMSHPFHENPVWPGTRPEGAMTRSPIAPDGPYGPGAEGALSGTKSTGTRSRPRGGIQQAAAVPSIPSRSMKATTWSRPVPFFRLLNTQGRSPRMRLLSAAITSSEAPT